CSNTLLTTGTEPTMCNSFSPLSPYPPHTFFFTDPAPTEIYTLSLHDALPISAGERQVVVTIEYGSERERVAYDLVVVAIGFQARWFEGLLGPQARRRLASALAGAELEQRIELDLSVAGLNPPLHLPLVTGLAHGPGFP